MTSTDYLLPQLPFGSAEYTIIRWLKRAGAAVAAGEPLLVIVNDRVEAALPATCAGTLERVWSVEGAAVAAGARVATIVANSAQQISEPVVRISPVAQRIAHTTNIDITELHGTGVSGRIVKADLLAALASQTSKIEDIPAAPLAVTHHLSLVMLTVIDVDLERVALAITAHGPCFARRRLELNFRVCIAAAAIAALPSHPLLNSYWADSAIVMRRRVHLALVAHNSTAFFIRDTQDLNLRGLARGFSGASVEHRSAQHTFAIVELGDHVWGDSAAFAGGTAALGIGAVRTHPLVIDDGGGERLAIRHAARLTLAYDARVLDQHYADAFLRDVKSRLEQFHL